MLSRQLYVPLDPKNKDLQEVCVSYLFYCDVKKYLFWEFLIFLLPNPLKKYFQYLYAVIGCSSVNLVRCVFLFVVSSPYFFKFQFHKIIFRHSMK